MERKKILLSILIPTYNRDKYLKKALKNFFLQIDDNLKNEIEILVSDNCSVDKTQEILKKYNLESKKKIQYRYWKNDKNLGYDRNFLKLIEEASGKFCWVFGDDEYLIDDSLKKICNILRKNEDIGILHLKNTRGNISEKKYKNSNECIKDINYMISFITANIFNKNIIDFKIKYKDLIGCCLIQEYFYIQSILKAKENIVVNDIFFKTDRADNVGGYKLFNIFGEQQNIILKYFLKSGLEKTTIDFINKKMLKEFFPHWIKKARESITKNKWENEDIYIEMKKTFDSYWEFKFYCIPVIKFPLLLAKIYCFIIMIKNKIEKEI